MTSALAQAFPFMLFMGTLKAHQLHWLHWVLCAFIVVFGELILLNLLVSLVSTGSLPALTEIFTTRTITLYSAQLVFALAYFYYIERERDGSIAGWVIAVLAGAFVLYVIIPFLVHLFV